LNVNLAHAVAPGWERTFQSYWSFWLVLSGVTAVVLFVSGMIFWAIWRPERAEELATGEL
jgi:heme/copper-type cytochrome/quinol oxidase subunit 2